MGLGSWEVQEGPGAPRGQEGRKSMSQEKEGRLERSIQTRSVASLKNHWARESSKACQMPILVHVDQGAAGSHDIHDAKPGLQAFLLFSY